MKNIYFLFLILLVAFSSCKTTKPVTEKKPESITKPAQATDAAPAPN